MAYKPSLRRLIEVEDMDLDIKPVMNLMVVLIPLLLAGSEFTKLAIKELNLPPAKNGGGGGGDETPEEELEMALAHDEMVIVCWEPGCMMHRLPHWNEGTWVARKQQKGYRNYSHGICFWHYQAYQKQIDQFIAEEMEPKVAAVAYS